MGRAGKAIAAILVLLGIAVIIAGIMLAWWLSRDGGDFFRDQQRIHEEGTRFGVDADDAGCLRETLDRLRKTPGLSGGMGSIGFLQFCLKPARRTEAFCRDVPTPLEMIDSAAYQQARCNDAGLGKEAFCKPVYGEVQQECYRRSLETMFKE